MDFINDLIRIIENDLQYNHSLPAQHLIYQYTCTQCYDCNMLLNNELNDDDNKIIDQYVKSGGETIKCNKCNIYRCSFHFFVNNNANMCVSCQTEQRQDSYYDIYRCIVCLKNAKYGHIGNVFLCDICYNNNKNKYSNIKCCGTGWYFNERMNAYLCSTHKYKNDTYTYTKN